MKNKILVSVSVVSLLAAIGSATALGWMYRKVRAFEKEHHVSIVTPASAMKELPKATANFENGKVYGTDVGDLAYVVKDGDDVISIAIRFNVSPSAILDINELKQTDPINPGDILKLPENAKVDGSDIAVGMVRMKDDATNGVTVAKAETPHEDGNDTTDKHQMKVLNVSYDGDMELDISLAERPDMDVVRHYVSVSPMHEGVPGFRYRARHEKRNGKWDFYPHLIVTGDFALRSKVVLKVRKGLPLYGKGANPDAEGSLAEDFTYEFQRKDLEPSVRYAAKGRYLPPAGSRAIGIEAVNVTNVYAELRRVEPRNVVQMLAREEDVYSKYNNYDWATDTKGVDKEDTGELAGEVETFTLPCLGKPNEKRLVPFRLTLKDGKPQNGIYLAAIRMKDHERRDRVSWWDDDKKSAIRNPNIYRVVCVSDLGLSVRESGADEMGVWVTSLTTGRPVAGAKVEIYSTANIKIKEGVADDHGWCVPKRIDKGKPFAVVAIAPDNGDMSFMAVRSSMTIDETYPDGARDAYLKKGECSAFVWTERGIYRHDEKIFLHAFLRDGELKAPKPFPVEVVLRNPSDDPYAVKTFVPDANGTFACDSFTVPADQPSGVWNLQVRTPGKKGKVLATREVKIEEFAPPQIRVKVNVEKNQELKNFAFGVSAEHLFGGPARSLPCEGAVVFEDAPFAPEKWKGYRFGNEDRGLKPSFRELGRQSLGEDGKVRFAAPLWADSGLPKAAVRVTAQGVVFEDGGRPATARGSDVCHYYPYYIGSTMSGWVKRPKSGPLKVPVACVLPDGSRLAEAKTLVVKVESIESVYTYKKNEDGWSSWDCTRIRTDALDDMKFVTAADRDAELVLPLTKCGDYALTITDPVTRASYGHTFYLSDWGDDVVRAPLSNPTEVTVQPDKKFYRVGETPRLMVKSPFAGAALLSVLRDGMVYTEVLDLTNATSEVTLRPVERSWMPSVDVTISVVQSVEANANHLAVRAHGQTVVCVRPEENEIPVKLDAKVAVGESGGSVVTVDVDACWNAATGTVAVVTVVDEGINLLTAEETPDPVGSFAFPRTAEHPLYDIYGKILPVIGDELRRSGVKTGGGFGAEMLGRVSPVPTRRFKPLALWKNEIPLVGGKARTEICLPEFVGEVRVTAVAYSSCAIGAASIQRKVTPKLVMQPDAPRFVAPGDAFELTLPLFNRSGAKGEIRWRLAASGSVELTGVADGVVTLENDGSTVVSVKAKATANPGQGVVSFTTEGFGEKHANTIEIPVRPAVAWRERVEMVRLDPGAKHTFTVEGALAKQQLTVSGSRLGELTAALEWLAAYPHGCLEQTTSRIFPLVTAGGILNTVGSKAAANRAAYVAAGVKRVESMVRANDFVMWPDCSYAPWDREVSLYAAHFLVEAERAGQKLNPTAKAQVMKYLGKWALSTNDTVSAYACHTLALAGQPEKDRMLKLYDGRAKLSFLDRARLARAFVAIRDAARAEALLANAQTPQSVKEAAFLTLAMLDLKPDDPRIPPLLVYLEKARDPAKFSWGTTDSNAHALLAIGEYYRHHPVKAGAPKVAVRPAKGSEITLGERETAKFDCGSITVENHGETTAFLSWEGLDLPPVEAVKDESNEIFISRKFFTAQGEPARLKDLVCGEMLVAELTVTSAATRVLSDLVVEDLFAGAFEPVHSELDPSVWGKRGGSDAWVMRKDARDDRMLVFSKKFTLEKGKAVQFRYPVRVVSAGDFILPGPAVEAMYQPTLRSHRAAERLTSHH